MATRLARLSVLSAALLQRIIASLRVLHSGFWLGVLDRDEATLATNAFYARSSQYTNDDYNLSGLTEWEHTAVATHTDPGARILVPAAGAGREVIGLANDGYVVVGYDPNPILVETGLRLIAEHQIDATLLHSGGSALPDNVEGPFACVLFGWGGISHVIGEAHRIALLRSLFDHLEPGGTLIVSFLDRSESDRTYAAMRRIASAIRSMRRSTQRIELGDVADGSVDHRFTFSEMGAELEAAGFEEIMRASAPYAHVIGRKP